MVRFPHPFWQAVERSGFRIAQNPRARYTIDGDAAQEGSLTGCESPNRRASGDGQGGRSDAPSSPLDRIEPKPPYSPLSEEQKKRVECGLDGVSALSLPKPKNREEEDKLVERFLVGLRKLLSQNDNWAFWQPLMQSLEGCVRCQTCSDACPVYVSSGNQEIYRPTYKSEILRRIINKYVKKRGTIPVQTDGRRY